MPAGRNMHKPYMLLLLLAIISAPSLADHRDGQVPTLPAPWQVAANDDWNTLDEEEQQLLRQHRDQWKNYTPEQKARLRQGVHRYQRLSPDERQGAERGRERYETMSPDERQRLREKYNRSRER